MGIKVRIISNLWISIVLVDLLVYLTILCLIPRILHDMTRSINSININCFVSRMILWSLLLLIISIIILHDPRITRIHLLRLIFNLLKIRRLMGKIIRRKMKLLVRWNLLMIWLLLILLIERLLIKNLCIPHLLFILTLDFLDFIFILIWCQIHNIFVVIKLNNNIIWISIPWIYR